MGWQDLPSFDHPVRTQQDGPWDGNAERLGGLQVDDQLEQGRLLDGNVGRLGTLEDLVGQERGPTQLIRQRGTIAEPASANCARDVMTGTRFESASSISRARMLYSSGEVLE